MGLTPREECIELQPKHSDPARLFPGLWDNACNGTSWQPPCPMAYGALLAGSVLLAVTARIVQEQSNINSTPIITSQDKPHNVHLPFNPFWPDSRPLPTATPYSFPIPFQHFLYKKQNCDRWGPPCLDRKPPSKSSARSCCLGNPSWKPLGASGSAKENKHQHLVWRDRVQLFACNSKRDFCK